MKTYLWHVFRLINPLTKEEIGISKSQYELLKNIKGLGNFSVDLGDVVGLSITTGDLLPDVFSELPGLKQLSVKNPHYYDGSNQHPELLPASIIKLNKLTHLKLNNCFVNLNDFIRKDLKVIDFQEVELAGIENLSKYPSLEVLRIIRSNLDKLPGNLSKNLVVLDVSHNNIKVVPEEIAQLYSSAELVDINFDYNPIEKLPSGLEYLKRWWKQ